MVGRPGMPYADPRVADDDTRYRIVSRRRPPTRDASVDGERRRSRRSTAVPAVPVLADGTAQPVERVRRPLTPPRETVVTLPRRFGGTDVVVEDHGDHIAIVLPGALRLVGTRDEAVALAAALLHTVDRTR
jgi:hypothetical protein